MAIIWPAIVAQPVHAVSNLCNVNRSVVDEGRARRKKRENSSDTKRARETERERAGPRARTPTRRCWGRFTAGEMKINDSAARN